jgi:hypothetical protein
MGYSAYMRHVRGLASYQLDKLDIFLTYLRSDFLRAYGTWVKIDKPNDQSIR